MLGRSPVALDSVVDLVHSYTPNPPTVELEFVPLVPLIPPDPPIPPPVPVVDELLPVPVVSKVMSLNSTLLATTEYSSSLTPTGVELIASTTVGEKPPASLFWIAPS